jgi:hypothetical protein
LGEIRVYHLLSFKMDSWNQVLLALIGLLGFLLAYCAVLGGLVTWDKWCCEVLREDSLDKNLPKAKRRVARERYREARDQRQKGLRSYLLWNLTCSGLWPPQVVFRSLVGFLSSCCVGFVQILVSCLSRVVSSAYKFGEAFLRPWAGRQDGQDDASKDNMDNAGQGQGQLVTSLAATFPPTQIPEPSRLPRVVRRRAFRAANSSNDSFQEAVNQAANGA